MAVEKDTVIKTWRSVDYNGKISQKAGMTSIHVPERDVPERDVPE